MANTNGSADDEKRAYFRVDDVLPLIVRRLDPATGIGLKSRVIPGFGVGLTNFVGDDSAENESIPPALQAMLMQIDNKLNLILEKLFLADAELAHVESREISISAAGMRFKAWESVNVGDTVEIKLLILSQEAIWLVLFGMVKRMEPVEGGVNEVAIEFLEMEESVQEALIRYTLRRQGEIIRKQRRQDG
jgi:PilZ domain